MKVKFLKSVVINNKYHIKKGDVFYATKEDNVYKISINDNVIVDAPAAEYGKIFKEYVSYSWAESPFWDYDYFMSYDIYNNTLFPTDGSNDDIDDFGCFD